jgi:hypothetical protein
MSTVLSIDPKQLQAMAPFAVEPVTEVRAESHEAMVKRIAADCLKSKIANLDPHDLVYGLSCMTAKKHGAALRAAFLESAEALGDFVMNVIVHEMELSAQIDAEQIAMRVRGAEVSKPLHRFIRIVGDC